MASPVVFLTLERTIESILQKDFRRQNADVLEDLKKATDEGRFSAADQAIDRLKFEVSDAARAEIEFVGTNAILLGSSIAMGGRNPRHSVIATKGVIPNEMLKLVDQSLRGLSNRGADPAKKLARVVLANHELEDPTKPFSKAEDTRLSTRTIESVLEGSDYSASLSANLTTSRLVSYGFLRQAQDDGINQYQWNAVLDERVCPVCETLHGMVFDVQKSVDQMFTILNTQDPMELKSLAPWPSQSAGSVEDLAGMSPEEIQAAGIAPPAHPGCRCVLDLVGSVPQEEIAAKPVEESPLEGAVADSVFPNEAADPFDDDFLDLPEPTRPAIPKRSIKKSEWSWSSLFKTGNPYRHADGSFASAEDHDFVVGETTSPATGVGKTFSSMPVDKATSKEAKAWRKATAAEYKANPQFRAVADAATLFAQGEYQIVRAYTEKAVTGKLDERWTDSLVPSWADKALYGNPMATTKGYYEGQVNEEGRFRSDVTWDQAGVALVNAVADSEPMKEPIYRGIIVSKNADEYMKQLEVGKTFDVMGVTSFTTDKFTAEEFSRREAKGQATGSDKGLGDWETGIVLKIESGAKALPISAVSPWNQKELLSSGQFVVKEVKVTSTNRPRYSNTSREQTYEVTLEQKAVWKPILATKVEKKAPPSKPETALVKLLFAGPFLAKDQEEA